MKKKLIIILIILAAIVLIAANIKNGKKEVNIEKASFDASYIWSNTNNLPDEGKNNKWVAFRKKFTIDNTDNVEAKISVDSRYWLYVNGKMIVRDGMLKRAEKPNAINYDVVDISKHLKQGENTIAILAWYFGNVSFSHIDTTRGALLFECEAGGKKIISDSSWKVKTVEAYKDSDIEYDNERLSEPNILYDANLEIGEFYEENYDDSTWENAIVYGKANEAPWGELIRRDIPFFVSGENVIEYDNFENYKNRYTNKDETIVMDLPYKMQIYPYLKIDAKANERIDIIPDLENEETYNSHVTSYITKDGIQEFEGLSWISGNRIYYKIPKNVKIISLGYRITGYDSNIVGSFLSNDEILNKLFTMGVNTLKLNMRDTYMDCPDRERALWMGDASIDMEQASYVLDASAFDLYRRSINTFGNWQDNDILFTMNPTVLTKIQIPIQNYITIGSLYDYYMYSGDIKLLEDSYEKVKSYMNLWKVNSNGMLEEKLVAKDYEWEWLDDDYQTDKELLKEVVYYYNLTKLKNISELLGYKIDSMTFNSKLSRISKNFDENFWDGEGYKSPDYEKYDQRVNAFAVLSGLASEDKYDKISKILIEEKDNTPYMERYILEALCYMGKIEESQERMKTQYANMTSDDNDGNTLWEFFDSDVNKGSKNHAWSGGPIIIMDRYYAGIKPIEAGYKKTLIAPKLGTIDNLRSKVPTPNGEIELDVQKSGIGFNIKVKTTGTTDIKLPIGKEIKINGTNIDNFEKATVIEKDDEYVIAEVDEGLYEIIINK